MRNLPPCIGEAIEVVLSFDFSTSVADNSKHDINKNKLLFLQGIRDNFIVLVFPIAYSNGTLSKSDVC